MLERDILSGADILSWYEDDFLMAENHENELRLSQRCLGETGRLELFIMLQRLCSNKSDRLSVGLQGDNSTGGARCGRLN